MIDDNNKRITTSTWLALLTGVAIGLGIWGASKNLSGRDEAWDTPYYFPFLFVGGIVGGLIFRKNYFTLYLGTILGQLVYFAYLLAPREGGASLWPLGLFFLLLLSSITYFGAFGAAFLLRLLLKERSPWQ